MKKLSAITLLAAPALAGFLLCCCMLQGGPPEPRSYAKYPNGREPETGAAVVPIVYYSEFGAKGDGVTDDFEAIRATHLQANKTGATVMADPGATYYIGATTKTVFIRTDTDWGDANFIIDDTTIVKKGLAWEQSSQWLFRVESAEQPFRVYTVSGLKKNQPKVSLNLGKRVMLEAIDNTTRRYIRKGGDANAGAYQTDVFIVEKDGTVPPEAPILWDFNNITSLTAYPIDEHQLKITGGRFTTIAHKGGNSVDPYLWRGINVTRSNVIIDGIYHDIVGEELPMVSYYGFLFFTKCADVTVQNCMLTGRLYSQKGTYDIVVETSINFKAINCGQTNSITNSAYWGIFASNYSKNILFDGVEWSRFDAHSGVHNTTIKNSVIGHMGMQILGSGTLLIENTEVRLASNFLGLRRDYGATWEGNIYIKNCTFNMQTNANGYVLRGDNNGADDAGFPCFMPKYIYIDGFHVQSSSPNTVRLFHNNDRTAAGAEKYPYKVTEAIYIKNFTNNNAAAPGYIKANAGSYLNNIPVITNWTDKDVKETEWPSYWE